MRSIPFLRTIYVSPLVILFSLFFLPLSTGDNYFANVRALIAHRFAPKLQASGICRSQMRRQRKTLHKEIPLTGFNPCNLCRTQHKETGHNKCWKRKSLGSAAFRNKISRRIFPFAAARLGLNRVQSETCKWTYAMNNADLNKQNSTRKHFAIDKFKNNFWIRII